MRPLMNMAWVINRRLLLQFSPFVALYLGMEVMALRSGDPVQAGAVVAWVVILVPVIVTLQGLTQSVEEFVLALPVSRAQVVGAKYLSCLLGLGAGLALPLLTGWTAHLLAPRLVPALGPDLPGIGALVALLTAAGILVFLPFVYRLGPARGSTAFCVALAVLLAALAAWKGPGACLQALLDFSGRILEGRGFAAAVLGLAGILAACSLAFSVHAYGRARR